RRSHPGAGRRRSGVALTLTGGGSKSLPPPALQLEARHDRSYARRTAAGYACFTATSLARRGCAAAACARCSVSGRELPASPVGRRRLESLPGPAAALDRPRRVLSDSPRLAARAAEPLLAAPGRYVRRFSRRPAGRGGSALGFWLL